MADPLLRSFKELQGVNQVMYFEKKIILDSSRYNNYETNKYNNKYNNYEIDNILKTRIVINK